MSGTVKWKNEFLLGIDAIDSQHRTIFERLLALENSINKRDPWHIVQYLLAEVRESLKFHLAVEDALLEILAYPGLDEHRITHEKLSHGLGELESKIKDVVVNRHSSGEPLVAFFELWFIDHVLSEDHQYASHIKQCQLACQQNKAIG